MDAEAKHDHGHAHPGGSRYVICWVLLCVFTALTYGLRATNLGDYALLVALAIATTKASIVVLFFMHLWDNPGANRLVFVVSIVFLLVLIALVLADIGTRFPPDIPSYSPNYTEAGRHEALNGEHGHAAGGGKGGHGSKGAGGGKGGHGSDGSGHGKNHGE